MSLERGRIMDNAEFVKKQSFDREAEILKVLGHSYNFV